MVISNQTNTVKSMIFLNKIPFLENHYLAAKLECRFEPHPRGHPVHTAEAVDTWPLGPLVDERCQQ